MFQGTVRFQTKIKGNGVTFRVVAFNPNEPGVDTVEIEGPNGEEIYATVHLTSVASPDDGRTLAMKVHLAALDRIAFHYGLAIESLQCVGDQFSPLNTPPDVIAMVLGDYVYVSDTARIVSDIAPAELQRILTQASPPGEGNYGLFRSARQSLSPVEEFMHLYHILLMLYNDSQPKVDQFIEGQEPCVGKSLSPHTGKMETVYTRLRNEFGHARAGAALDKTKSEMATHLGGLMALTKRAIELHP